MTTEERVARAGVVAGILLAVLGVGGYVLTDFASVTALIPAVFGVVFVALGRLVAAIDRGDRAAYALGVVALLGIAGTGRGLSQLPALASGGDVDSPVAVGSQAVMALLCLAVLAVVGLYAVERR